MSIATHVVIYPDGDTTYFPRGHWNGTTESIICTVAIDVATRVQTNGWQEMQRFADALAEAAAQGRQAEQDHDLADLAPVEPVLAGASA